MENVFDQIKKVQDEAQLLKKKGDALKKAKQEKGALQAYEEGVQKLGDALDKWKTTGPPGSEDQNRLLRERAEMFGSRGGLLQRLNRPKEALDSYRDGAEIEDDLNLPSTYNRLNAVKSELLTGQKTLAGANGGLKSLADTIEKNLTSTPSLGDSGWSWADLGDCLALGGQLERAQNAYRAFIHKSETKSPERTLDVLRQIALKLTELGDPDAGKVQAAIDSLQVQLNDPTRN